MTIFQGVARIAFICIPEPVKQRKKVVTERGKELGTVSVYPALSKPTIKFLDNL
jgi:hypothetical protein